MPNYFYIAKSFEGETKTGILNAQDEHQLARDLKKEGVVLIKAVAQEETVKRKFDIPLPFSGVSVTEKIMMTRNLGIMFSTGLSLVKSFDILASQAKNKKLKSALVEIKEKINKGSSLSDALNGYPDIFSELFVSMIKIGEEGGTLEEILKNLSLQLEKQHELKSKITNAMTYPVIILMVMGVVGIVVVTFVLPSLKIFFTTLNVDVPIYTKILLFLGDYFSVHWYFLILGPLAIFAIIFGMRKTKGGRKIIDTILLKMPIISSIVKKNNSAALIRSLSSLIASGVPMTRSLEISANTMKNHYFKEALIEANKSIKKGEKLSHSLEPYHKLFPVGVIEMMEVGEETGKTSEILKKLANFYEQEAASAIEKLTTLIEPVLIIMLGLGVGFFAFSIIQPMYSSLQAITK